MMDKVSNQNRSYPEGLAVEFYFDPETEAKVFAFRDTLYRQGITRIQGLLNDKPHISLGVFPKNASEKLIDLTGEFSKSVKSFQFELSALGIFPTPENVFFLIPVPSRTMLSIHGRFHRLVKKEGLPVSEYYLPGKWVPHCTLEFNLPEEDLCRALLLSKAQFKPITGTIIQIGVVAFRPIEYLAHFDL